MTFLEIRLRDVQGLFGGRDLDVAADGSFSARVVRPGPGGLEATWRKGRLEVAEVAALEVLLDECAFPGIEIPDRPGVPDEARPTITLVREEGEILKARWEGQTHPGFDRIYAALRRIAGA